MASALLEGRGSSVRLQSPCWWWARKSEFSERRKPNWGLSAAPSFSPVRASHAAIHRARESMEEGAWHQIADQSAIIIISIIITITIIAARPIATVAIITDIAAISKNKKTIRPLSRQRSAAGVVGIRSSAAMPGQEAVFCRINIAVASSHEREHLPQTGFRAHYPIPHG